MATGSGKTLVMHANILQFQHYLAKHHRRRELNRIILLTPNEGLSQQHLREFAVAGIDAEHVGGRRAQRRFSREWPDLMRVPVTETLVARAEALAWAHGLRGYDAVQLASALTWQDALGREIVLATFNRHLWEAAPQAGLRAWPERLPN